MVLMKKFILLALSTNDVRILQEYFFSTQIQITFHACVAVVVVGLVLACYNSGPPPYREITGYAECRNTIIVTLIPGSEIITFSQRTHQGAFNLNKYTSFISSRHNYQHYTPDVAVPADDHITVLHELAALQPRPTLGACEACWVVAGITHRQHPFQDGEPTYTCRHHHHHDSHHHNDHH